MKNRRNDTIVAIVICIIIPTILFSVIANNKRAIDIKEGVTIQTTQSPSERKYHLYVLLDNHQAVKMELEEYITGVVLREMPANFELEALKAQAVVARTYTLRRYKSGGKHNDAVVCVNANCCQGYLSAEDYLSGNGKSELLEKVRAAVKQTEGKVLTYQGELIDATYFSCSGGMTEDAKAVWGADVPYLQATESPGEEAATHYVDTVTFTTKEFARLLNINQPKDSDRWIGSVSYTEGGGVDRIQICGKEFRGTTIRKELGLRSTVFMISVIGDTVTVTTKGFGHRVGMSQYGADAMAVQGSDYEQILTHYYVNTQVITFSQ